ncbi:Flp family type IVb pilin [Janthinobacterium fluminis]|uniref:Flp family type IVb pilin n=1 Tax=Janthinobacterium fluminis TaxID=2987524 RepID=A0ABT5K9Z3_9BURK|nr:Flp family type IVb pilin [Janthinobacterium fluminis]MDC8760886.1 Flp family type IVb pilin [Janthinobacterium fluminis]
MHTFISALRNFGRDEDGITAIEYGLIAALMAAAIGAMIAAVVGTDSTGLKGVFNEIATALNGAMA